MHHAPQTTLYNAAARSQREIHAGWTLECKPEDNSLTCCSMESKQFDAKSELDSRPSTPDSQCVAEGRLLLGVASAVKQTNRPRRTGGTRERRAG